MNTAETVKNECVIIPDTDIFETENEYTLKMEMPGIVKENLDIVLNNDQLEIHGKVGGEHEDENRYSEFELNDYNRKFTIGRDISRDKIEAVLNNGILTLVLHKTEEVKPKKIPITVQ